MALNNFNRNCLTPLHFKGLTWVVSVRRTCALVASSRKCFCLSSLTHLTTSSCWRSDDVIEPDVTLTSSQSTSSSSSLEERRLISLFWSLSGLLRSRLEARLSSRSFSRTANKWRAFSVCQRSS